MKQTSSLSSSPKLFREHKNAVIFNVNSQQNICNGDWQIMCNLVFLIYQLYFIRVCWDLTAGFIAYHIVTLNPALLWNLV